MATATATLVTARTQELLHAETSKSWSNKCHGSELLVLAAAVAATQVIVAAGALLQPRKINFCCLDKQQSTGISSKPCGIARQKPKQLQCIGTAIKIKQTGSGSWAVVANWELSPEHWWHRQQQWMLQGEQKKSEKGQQSTSSAASRMQCKGWRQWRQQWQAACNARDDAKWQQQW